VATKDLQEGIAVQKFEGPIIKCDLRGATSIPEEVPEEEICYMLIVDDFTILIPKSDARYMNHSCDPNCEIGNDLVVRTTKPVASGEELTFAYNIVKEGEDPGAWDPRWSFSCQCGAPNCQGTVDKYVCEDGTPWHRPGDPAEIEDPR
jgi:hypothetical protein